MGDMDYALSSEDLKKICPDIRVILYPEIPQYSSLDQLFSSGRNRPIALLYEAEPNMGHWVSLIRHGPNQYEFMDPYGLSPDDEFKFIPKDYREISGQMVKHLRGMGKSSDVVMYWSKKPIQGQASHIATCGRWVGLRCRMRQMPLKDFRNMFQDSRYTPDELVTGVTNMFLS